MREKIERAISGFKFDYLIGTITVISLFFLAYDNIQLRFELLEFKEAHHQPFHLAAQVRDLKASLAEIDSRLSRLNTFSSKLRVLTHIKEQFESGASLKQAMKSEPRSGHEVNLNREEERDLQKIRKKLGDLRSEALFHERTLAELADFYVEQPALLAAIPSLVPAIGRVTSNFGFRKLPMGGWRMHEGIDIAANFGTQVFAPADGMVEESNFSSGYGRYVVLNHGYGLKTRFAHASKLLVKAGEWIKRGEKIALVGGSGRVRGVHLHYEISLNGVPVDPRDYL